VSAPAKDALDESDAAQSDVSPAEFEDGVSAVSAVSAVKKLQTANLLKVNLIVSANSLNNLKVGDTSVVAGGTQAEIVSFKNEISGTGTIETNPRDSYAIIKIKKTVDGIEKEYVYDNTTSNPTQFRLVAVGQTKNGTNAATALKTTISYSREGRIMNFNEINPILGKTPNEVSIEYSPAGEISATSIAKNVYNSVGVVTKSETISETYGQNVLLSFESRVEAVTATTTTVTTIKKKFYADGAKLSYEYELAVDGASESGKYNHTVEVYDATGNLARREVNNAISNAAGFKISGENRLEIYSAGLLMKKGSYKMTADAKGVLKTEAFTNSYRNSSNVLVSTAVAAPLFKFTADDKVKGTIQIKNYKPGQKI
jgi:hypothetical protein